MTAKHRCTVFCRGNRVRTCYEDFIFDYVITTTFLSEEYDVSEQCKHLMKL